MNLPNKLTLSRICLIPFFVLALHGHALLSSQALIAASYWLAFVLFIIAAITDYYDGRIARERNIITNFGKLFDPLADKLLTMAAFVAFVEILGPDGKPIFPAWTIILILAREYLVTGLRSVALTTGTVIHADKWGKQKTVWQIIGIITVLLALSVRETFLWLDKSPVWFDTALPYVFKGMLSIIVFLTTFSGLMFLIKNWSVISDSD